MVTVEVVIIGGGGVVVLGVWGWWTGEERRDGEWGRELRFFCFFVYNKGNLEKLEKEF